MFLCSGSYTLATIFKTLTFATALCICLCYSVMLSTCGQMSSNNQSTRYILFYDKIYYYACAQPNNQLYSVHFLKILSAARNGLQPTSWRAPWHPKIGFLQIVVLFMAYRPVLNRFLQCNACIRSVRFPNMSYISKKVEIEGNSKIVNATEVKLYVLVSPSQYISRMQTTFEQDHQ